MPRVRCFTSLAIVLAMVSVFPAIAQPPQDLHMVGDHWTAWDPPAVDGEPYVIQTGDTLWSLAEAFLGDPYLWPQIWEANQYILDAHWIYPGDPLVMNAEIVPQEPMEDLGADGTSGGMMGDGGGADSDDSLTGYETADRSFTNPRPLGTESDIYCSGFISRDEIEIPYSITGSESQVLGVPDSEVLTTGRSGFSDNQTKQVLATGDIVYLGSGRDSGLSPGFLYTVVRAMGMVEHPHTREVVGRFYQYDGRVRILSVQQDSAIAEIVHSCRDIGVGAGLLQFEPEPVPLGRLALPRPASAVVEVERLDGAPTLVHTSTNAISVGQGDLVYVDRGEVDDLTPGDMFTVYRRNRDGFPPVVLGEVAILSVKQHTSLARILRSRYTIRVGDQLIDR